LIAAALRPENNRNGRNGSKGGSLRKGKERKGKERKGKESIADYAASSG
jgi:hypothetical protein